MLYLTINSERLWKNLENAFRIYDIYNLVLIT